MMPALGAEDKDKAGETEVVEKKPSGSLGELLTFAQPVDKLICVLAAVLFVAFGVAQILFIFFIKPRGTKLYNAILCNKRQQAENTVKVMEDAIKFYCDVTKQSRKAALGGGKAQWKISL